MPPEEITRILTHLVEKTKEYLRKVAPPLVDYPWEIARFSKDAVTEMANGSPYLLHQILITDEGRLALQEVQLERELFFLVRAVPTPLILIEIEKISGLRVE
jgi:hypothetical protein